MRLTPCPEEEPSRLLPDCAAVEVGGRREDVIEISFHDSGEGIPKQNFDKIFLPFSRRRRGVRLGLAQVHRIVELHDGWIKG